MLVTGFPAGMFQTNCYILAQDDARECIVIDPGQDAAAHLKKILNESNLRPVAVLLTHGHLDHTWSAQPICDEFDIPAYIHPGDRAMLADPASGIGPALSGVIGGLEFREPGKVIELEDHQQLRLAGVEIQIAHTPGHTRGSVVLRSSAETAEGPVPLVFTGDTLFAGSIGRSDLPGGDPEQLLRSIAERLLRLGDDTVVLPGHGETSSIGQERVSNPFLVGLTSSDGRQ